jgi:hypothetical protein
MVITAAQAIRRVLGFLDARLKLFEHEGAGRGPWLTMAGTGATRGQLRCYAGQGIDKIVFLTLEDDGQLESAMLMAFSEAGSVVPHLVLDASPVGRDYAVFADLVPRVDLSVNPEYVHAVYAPLWPVFDGLKRHPQLRPSEVPHSLAPYVSPAMAGFRASAAIMPQLFELVGPYVSHWLALHQGIITLPPELREIQGLKARDERHRALLFSKEVDPIWDVFSTVVGAENCRRALELLRLHGIPLSYSLRPAPAMVD